MMEECIDEVMRSNNSKACKSPGEVADTISFYESQNIPVNVVFKKPEDMIVGEGFKALIYRKEDAKLLKNKYYSKANLVPIVEKYLK